MALPSAPPGSASQRRAPSLQASPPGASNLASSRRARPPHLRASEPSLPSVSPGHLASLRAPLIVVDLPRLLSREPSFLWSRAPSLAGGLFIVMLPLHPCSLKSLTSGRAQLLATPSSSRRLKMPCPLFLSNTNLPPAADPPPAPIFLSVVLSSTGSSPLCRALQHWIQAVHAILKASPSLGLLQISSSPLPPREIVALFLQTPSPLYRRCDPSPPRYNALSFVLSAIQASGPYLPHRLAGEC